MKRSGGFEGRLHAKGVLWKPPSREEEDWSLPLLPSALRFVVLRLYHSSEVSIDRNYMFTASLKAMGDEGIDTDELQRRTMARRMEKIDSISGHSSKRHNMHTEHAERLLWRRFLHFGNEFRESKKDKDSLLKSR
ncbi:hypothetical protein JHK82_039601 [Glycine max]|nr:hypothetical protein JHK86_039791 [Glycine max]KAG4965394.1 hypothetical protein JHK85_040369 [Glycine max]KAG5110378.1 hypothetical protein JHK82_039601 [Glycine max]KAG5121663.1 hypothetical protein JHK84_040003 [Glycine max]